WAQSDGRHVGELCAGVAGRQPDVPIPTGLGVDVAFDRGGGRGQHHGVLGEAAAHNGHVAGLVVHAIFLLEASVVLFVNDDEPQILVGQEDSGASTDHHTHFAVGGRTASAR